MCACERAPSVSGAPGSARWTQLAADCHGLWSIVLVNSRAVADPAAGSHLCLFRSPSLVFPGLCLVRSCGGARDWGEGGGREGREAGEWSRGERDQGVVVVRLLCWLVGGVVQSTSDTSAARAGKVHPTTSRRAAAFPSAPSPAMRPAHELREIRVLCYQRHYGLHGAESYWERRERRGIFSVGSRGGKRSR